MTTLITRDQMRPGQIVGQLLVVRQSAAVFQPIHHRAPHFRAFVGVQGRIPRRAAKIHAYDLAISKLVQPIHHARANASLVHKHGVRPLPVNMLSHNAGQGHGVQPPPFKQLLSV